MPVIPCKDKNGKIVGWKWGLNGECVATKEEAERIGAAAYANQTEDSAIEDGMPGESVEWMDARFIR